MSSWCGWRRCFAGHETSPGGRLLFRAPDRARLGHRMGAKDGNQERVDGHVAHFFELSHLLATKTAVRIFERSDDSRSVALYGFDSILEGQILEHELAELLETHLGEVRLGGSVNDRTEAYKRAGFVGIYDASWREHFIQTSVGRRHDLFHHVGTQNTLHFLDQVAWQELPASESQQKPRPRLQTTSLQLQHYAKCSYA